MSEQYLPYRPVGETSRPLIMVRFSRGSFEAFVSMLVDTGADNIVLPAHMMAELGVSPDECASTLARTNYGRSDALLGPELQLDFPDLWDDRSFRATVTFSPMFDDRLYGLLGRDPTFDYVGFRFGHDLGYGFHVEWLGE